MARRSPLLALSLVAALVACGAPEVDDRTGPDPQRGEESVGHAYDLATHLPPHLAIMFAMSWFGLAPNDPQGAGGDPSWGNWHWTSSCGQTNDPASCQSFSGSEQRSIASRRRPLAGIYSSSGRTTESRERIDLMLSTVRRRCDDGARLDAFAVQLDSVKFTSRYPTHLQSTTWDIAYRSLLAFLEEADAHAMEGAVMVSIDSTVYWHFGAKFGLATQAQRTAALADDLADMARIAAAHPSATRVNGKPIFLLYTDSALMTAAEWQAVFASARAQSGGDFYTVGNTLDTSYFAAFDALSPWAPNLGIWSAATGTTLRERGNSLAAHEHDKLIAALPSYSGRAVFGGATPGFDDYTLDWGQCRSREIPRDPQVLDGQFDYFQARQPSHPIRGIVFETWDDWTEGSELEPDLVDGTAKLRQVRDRLGQLYGDPADAAGDSRLDARWRAFGQPRSCCGEGGACPSHTPVGLDCAAACAPGAFVLEPTEGQQVGPSIHLRASASTCDSAHPIGGMHAYLDSGSTPVCSSSGTGTIDCWVAVTVGAHHVNVNAWDSSGKLYPSTHIDFTR